MQEQQQMQSLAQLNKAINDFNALKIRLDPEQYLMKLEIYLRGKMEQYTADENGNPQIQIIKVGDALANDKGIQNIMAWATSVINTQTVQGNFPVDKHGYSLTYEQFLYSFRVNFCYDIVLNMYDWEIEEEKIEGIVDRTCLLVEAYISRCIGNEERKSYGETMRTIESNVSTARSGINLFKK